MKRRKSSKIKAPFLLAGGSMLAVLGLLFNPAKISNRADTGDVCQVMVQSQSFLSRKQLSQLLTVPERGTRAQVRQVMKEPYCKLSAVEVRAGVKAEREAYPLEFDPKVWIVVLYEGDEYAGYSFSFRR